ncbi:hypothetical protein GYMLUDRAFT_578225 [Collybiopsis luxurians FD-317 M1]|uniref:Uncharacterized protein n=1 Tax=Collybiopsis luxurians FD-317 M1 TaxID=944289 RepID=A0A0D0CGN6_9AGAR|nr:hypothetical protein GYMLUDRAFT_578225 [Collybiopsis luxurians FD-317 M1]
MLRPSLQNLLTLIHVRFLRTNPNHLRRAHSMNAYKQLWMAGARKRLRKAAHVHRPIILFVDITVSSASYQICRQMPNKVDSTRFIGLIMAFAMIVTGIFTKGFRKNSRSTSIFENLAGEPRSFQK